MANDVRIWQVNTNENTLQRLNAKRLDLESRLHDWLRNDITILADDLMVIGSEVPTAYGTSIDLLCIDPGGNLVVVELKRDRTPRDVVAQALDYASWVKGLSTGEVIGLGNHYCKEEGGLGAAFGARFGETLPDTLNGAHRMVIVASAMDAATERIVRYLSETFSVGINVAEFVYHQDSDGHEFISRAFLVDPDAISVGPDPVPGKRKKPLTLPELQSEAEKKGVGEMYRYLYDHSVEIFDGWWPTLSSVGFFVKGVADDYKTCAVFSLIPTESSEGHLMFEVYLERLKRYLSATEQEIIDILPVEKKPWKYFPSADAWSSGFEGHFSSMQEAERFVTGITALKSASRN